MGANVIVVSCDMFEELARHELGHLFAGRWSRWAPPLLSEGLATWLQKSIAGVPIDTHARSHCRCSGHWLLLPLLKQGRFYSDKERIVNYILAGSFTGFLIRRFGWEKYQHFYRHTSKWAWFEKRFEKFFGISHIESDAVILHKEYQAGFVFLADPYLNQSNLAGRRIFYGI